MNERVWFLPGSGGQSRGPFAAEEVLDEYARGSIDKGVYVYRQGMAGWAPLSAVEPFASAIAERERLRRRRRASRTIGILSVLALLAALGGGFAVYFFVFREPAEIKNAREMIAAGLYSEAMERLGPFLAAHPDDDRAMYYSGIARLNLYATGKWSPDLDDRQVLSLLQQAFLKDASWRDKAKSDVPQACDRVQADGRDPAARLLGINWLCRELKLVEGNEAAKALLDRLRKIRPGKAPWAWENWCDEVLKWDPSTADEVLRLTLPGEDNSDFASDFRFTQWLNAVSQSAEKNSAVAQPASLALAKFGDEAMKLGKAETDRGKAQAARPWFLRAKRLFAAAERIHPDAKSDVSKKAADLDKLLDPNEQRYQGYMDEAKKALAEARFAEARTSAQEALRVRARDAAAADLVKRAEAGLRAQDLGKDVADANQLIADHQPEKATQALKAAVKRWGENPELAAVQKRAEEMLVSDHKTQAKTALESKDFQLALREAGAAMGLRPKDAETAQIERRARQGMAETLKTSGQQAHDRKDFGSAVNAFAEALKMTPDDNAIKGLLATAVTEQVAYLTSPAQMEYGKARQAVAGVQTLLDDAAAKKLFEAIDAVETDPKTTNVTGFWKAPAGVVRLEGADKAIAISMGATRQQLQSVGSWDREEDRLKGSIPDPRGKLLKGVAKILDARTIQVTVSGMKPPTVTWTKEEDAAPEPPIKTTPGRR